MPALRPTHFSGEIVFLGQVEPGHGLASTPVEKLVLGFDGAEGEKHSGLTRSSCSRVLDLHPRGTEIANTRQLTVLSDEELAETAFALHIPRLAPEWVGASIVLRGLPDLTHLPPSSRLQGPDGATLVVEMENLACVLPGKVLEHHHPGKGARYKPAASGRRGIVTWVERPGVLTLGDTLRLFVPAQRRWSEEDNL
ncbi:MOSC domain-containing protein [Sedimentimonas flavescens]|uniref:MOSC domain-containing protein n=1 Tax=Sedimentimonas flavescens TaxID=2851012 RepID=UPI0021A93A00|nr:sulfurase [Sedimentimonas flavescens]MCT2539373.1 sulfurase [Sedimentimonas flavescens]